METNKTLPILNAVEVRVLGSLMEKSKTTPDYYPMTINALTAACNQKTSRKPVVDYDETTVMDGINSLKQRGYVSTATGGFSRATKYKHNLAIVFPFTPDEVAVICLLLLRGPLTPGEINSNSGRLYEFDSLEEVQTVLDKLSTGDIAFVMQLPRRPGQKETRYVHLFAGTPDIAALEAEEEQHTAGKSPLEERVTILEKELADLKESFNKLMKELMG
ncbi:YceH family protein [Foetidibacter luteolus]|uniref:YceH family protein n=1 Tax=Foetidibacter luteolus TaxID=2608880 RepID=UPI00129A8705|nr:YceH family protein [Foetidibacter luteolus]